MAENIDDLTVSYYEDDVEIVKELDRKVLSKGAWSTIVFKFQEWNAKEEKYGPIKFTIRRYQKTAGAYKQRSKFNISNVEQAQKIITTLQEWVNEEQ